MARQNIKSALRESLKRHRQYRERSTPLARAARRTPSADLDDYTARFRVERPNDKLAAAVVARSATFTALLAQLSATGDLTHSKQVVRRFAAESGSKGARWKISAIDSRRGVRLGADASVDDLVEHLIACSTHVRQVVDQTVDWPRRPKERARNQAERLLRGSFSALNQLDRVNRPGAPRSDHLRLASYGLTRP